MKKLGQVTGNLALTPDDPDFCILPQSIITWTNVLNCAVTKIDGFVYSKQMTVI
jgi:hypothetical protein